ncbi:MAG: hypothetical protein KDA21_06780 [Phycisphaerales bacterium]|nr:hypothetical protein [Phycisphaerales bacterium]
MNRIQTMLAAVALAAPAALAGTDGPDVTFCQLYGLSQFGRSGDVVGLSLATTSWNLGNKDLAWFQSPDSEHPMIVMNLYRILDDRFEQVGQSWIKHGFFALSNTQCGGSCTFEPGHSGGDWLGQGCTDTYGASLNSGQSGLGPRFEVNPWTGGWSYAGSYFQGGGPANNGITRRLQVHDADLDAGGQFFGEGYYVHFEDVDVMNSAAWKPVTVSGSPGGTWSFGMSGSGTFPNIGFAFDAWTGATQTIIAQEVPVNEATSPDGRCVLCAKATDNGDGTWHYEYFLYNVDMDRQVDSFEVPLAPGTIVTNVGFHAVEHHNEPTGYIGGPAINNNAWASSVGSSSVSWSTSTNPIRWGTGYNFRFDANVPPDDVNVVVGQFKSGGPATISGMTVGPVQVPPQISILLPSGAPSEMLPGTTYDIDVELNDGSETVTGGTLEYRYDGGSYQSVALNQISGNLYRATLPAADCGDTPEFYFTASGTGGAMAVDPPAAPGTVYNAIVGETIVAQDDKMEGPGDDGYVVNAGGTDDATTGVWERGDPNGSGAQPEDDHSDPGVNCWFTGQAAPGAGVGTNDVDGGSTTLYSPVFDLSSYQQATISYYRWYTNDQGSAPNADTFVVEINDGSGWTNLETVGPASPGAAWIYAEFDVASVASLSSTVQLRFIASDLGSGSIVEAAIDDLRIDTFGCVSVPTNCDGDANGDLMVDFDDLNVILSNWGGAGPAGDVFPAGGGDGNVNFDDLNFVLNNWGTNCN